MPAWKSVLLVAMAAMSSRSLFAVEVIPDESSSSSDIPETGGPDRA
jgi:hypothetical protein